MLSELTSAEIAEHQSAARFLFFVYVAIWLPTGSSKRKIDEIADEVRTTAGCPPKEAINETSPMERGEREMEKAVGDRIYHHFAECEVVPLSSEKIIGG